MQPEKLICVALLLLMFSSTLLGSCLALEGSINDPQRYIKVVTQGNSSWECDMRTQRRFPPFDNAPFLLRINRRCVGHNQRRKK